MVTFGGIDGYSRVIIYLACHSNNLAATTLKEFVGAVEKFGLPSRVHSDMGVENVDIARFMLNHPDRGEGRGTFITGKSIHNQRQERLWQDVNIACVAQFYELFVYMEESGILNVNNECHLFCLHFVFIPRFNSQLKAFQEGWNNHGLTTEHNKTPMQLWIQGMFDVANTSHRTAREFWEPRTDVSNGCVDFLKDFFSSGA